MMNEVLCHPNFDQIKSSNEVSGTVTSPCCVFVKNLETDEVHHLLQVDTQIQFQDLLIKYCRNQSLNVKQYVFLVPCEDDALDKTHSWKIASPSARLLECISKTKDCPFSLPFESEEEHKIYLQCVPKHDVHRFVSWNKCLSTKYSGVPKNESGPCSETAIKCSRKKKRQAPLPPNVISDNSHPVAHDNAKPSEHERLKSFSNPADPESNNVTAKNASSFSDMLLKWYQSDVHLPVRQKSIQTGTPSAFSNVSHRTHTFTSVGTSPVGSLDRSFVSPTFTGSLTIERGTYDADSADCTECCEPVENQSPSPPSQRPSDLNFPEVLTDGPTSTVEHVVEEAENVPGTASGLLSSRVSTLADRQIGSPDSKSGNACEAVERFVPSVDYLKDARATLKKISSRSKSPTILSHTSSSGMETTRSSQENDARESVDWSSRFWSPEKAPSTLSFMIPK